MFLELLLARGLSTPQAIEAFFHPNIENLHDPFLMKDMERAVVRLARAMDEQESILVYGDYDVDGTTAVSIVYSFLGELGMELGVYIPDRYREGYGISEAGVLYAAENDFTLIIALDCGIKAYKQIELANSLGVDVIVCDHHFPDAELPPAYAVLDPKRSDCPYPCKSLSGAGVGFKLLQALSLRRGYPLQNLFRHLDLLAISIAADLVEIEDENRILATEGLHRLNTNPSPGIQALKNVTGIGKREIDVQDIIFRLGPRINAAGRMMNGSIAVELFTSPDSETAALYAQIMNSSNIERQGIDRMITNDAIAMLARDPAQKDRQTTVLYNGHWHKGVIGIVASRLVDIYYRPTVVLTKLNGIISGSVRSITGFDVYEVISECSDLLESYGGHKQAVGLTMLPENIERFKERFEQLVAQKISQQQKSPTLEIDALITFDDLRPSFIRTLEAFAPYGQGNPAPIFALQNVPADPNARLFGRNHEHIKFSIGRGRTSPTFTAIAYQQATALKTVQQQPFDICFTIETNKSHSPSAIQLNVKDIIPA